MYDLETHDFFKSRDVVFHEESFPFQGDEFVTKDVPEGRVEGSRGLCLQNKYAEASSPVVGANSSLADQLVVSSGLDAKGSNQVLQPTIHTVKDNNKQPTAQTDAGVSSSTTGPNNLGQEATKTELGRDSCPITTNSAPICGYRIRKTPAHFDQYICYTTQSKNPVSPASPLPTDS